MRVGLLSLPLILLSSGCGVSYHVGINGYLSTTQDWQVPESASISVITDSNAPNPFLEEEIGMKIQTLLDAKGYDTEAKQPSYYLLFDYGIGPGETVTETIPVYRPRGYYEDPPFFSGYTTYVPYSEVVYTRWLVLRLADGHVYRDSRKVEPLWIGEAASAGSSSDLREVINYMLIAAFEYFGKDTGRQVSEFIWHKDERVQLLVKR
jgi:hypothetical protein